MSELEDRIRARAYQLWLAEGSPEGREHDHWNLARELIAIEDSQLLATKPVPHLGPQGEPVEPIESVENAGEFPTLTDQGEQELPRRRTRRRKKPPAYQPENQPRRD